MDNELPEDDEYAFPPMGYYDDDPNPLSITHRYTAQCVDCPWFTRGFSPNAVVRLAGKHVTTYHHSVHYEWGY